MDSTVNTLELVLKLLGVIITVLGSWGIAVYTTKKGNENNKKSLEHKIKEINTSSKLENIRVVNLILLDKGAELSALLPELMRYELSIGTRELYVYYKNINSNNSGVYLTKALEAINKTGDMRSIIRKKCSILFTYFPELKINYLEFMKKFNGLIIYELMYQEDKLKNIDSIRAQKAMSPHDYINTYDNYALEFMNLIEQLDSVLSEIIIDMKKI